MRMAKRRQAAGGGHAFSAVDFARNIGGDKVEVSMLLPPGTESHSYDPTPSDIISISNADVFLYTGSTMEPWASTILDGAASDTLTVVDLSEHATLLHEGEHDTEISVYDDGSSTHMRPMNMIRTYGLTFQTPRRC